MIGVSWPVVAIHAEGEASIAPSTPTTSIAATFGRRRFQAVRLPGGPRVLKREPGINIGTLAIEDLVVEIEFLCADVDR